MDLPVIKRNTFVKSEEKTNVDIVLKPFVYCELLLGVNRFPIISKNRILIALFYLYSLTVNVLICYVAFNIILVNHLADAVRILKVLQYGISAVLNMLTWKRFHCFFKEIEKFDFEVGCRPKISKTSIKLLVFFGIPIAFSLCLFTYITGILIVPFNLITTFEYFYFSYLIELMLIRMRLLNYYMECLTSTPKTDSSPKITEFVFFDSPRFPNMGKMMELYQIIINAHKFFMDAVKWLILIMLVTSFISSIVIPYSLLLWSIDAANLLKIDHHIIGVVMSYLQLFLPCVNSDRLREEVSRFRELLANSLYENQLDRSSRITTRSLLALTETRNLSFSMFRVLDVSVSLPFSFLGFIMTYLIILLQFKKVIYP